MVNKNKIKDENNKETKLVWVWHKIENCGVEMEIATNMSEDYFAELHVFKKYNSDKYAYDVFVKVSPEYTKKLEKRYYVGYGGAISISFDDLFVQFSKDEAKRNAEKDAEDILKTAGLI